MRPIRVLLGLLGMDQHEVGAVAVARLLRDAGMEVVYLGRFNLPPEIARAAADEGVDVIGLSCHSWEYLHYVDELLARLREEGITAPVVLGGSVITPEDAHAMAGKGIAASFGPGIEAAQIVATIRRLAGRDGDGNGVSDGT